MKQPQKTKTQINNEIIDRARQLIMNMGLKGLLDIYPVTNTCLDRQRHFYKDNMNYFKVHMWTLNKLSPCEYEKELIARIEEACAYFNLPHYHIMCTEVCY